MLADLYQKVMDLGHKAGEIIQTSASSSEKTGETRPELRPRGKGRLPCFADIYEISINKALACIAKDLVFHWWNSITNDLLGKIRANDTGLIWV